MSPTAPASEPLSRGRARRWLSRLIKIVYGLAMFEVVIMISPFAFYFYGAYGPSLNFLDHFRATSWLTGFMLPHAVFTTSAGLEFMRWEIGRYSFALGLLGFFLFAALIYGSKLLRRTAVFSGPYRFIRHPQYLCLGISAFGLFTLWPRIIIFWLLIGMLFAYYFLARVEEKRMLAQDSGYQDYMRRTGMFLPGAPGRRLYSLVFGRMRDQRHAHRLALASALGLLLLASYGLREYTLGHISHTQLSPHVQVVSVYPLPGAELQRLAGVAMADSGVQQTLQREPGATFVAHILPYDYGMMNMFADIRTQHMSPANVHRAGFKVLGRVFLPFLEKDVRKELMGSNGQHYQVVLSRVDDPGGRPVTAAGVFAPSAKMTPVSIAEMDATGSVVRTIEPPRHSFWGAVKMPVF